MSPRPLCISCAYRLRNRASLAPSSSILVSSTALLNQPTTTPLHSQCRAASILSSLSDLPGAYSRRIRVGRGPSSGHGKTSGRGHKGQRQHGKVPAGFEGGQTPIEVVHGKRGFKNPFSVDLTTLPLSRIQSFISQNRISRHAPITVRELVRSNCISMPKDGVKLLATSFSHQSSLDAQPPLTYPLHIVVSRASASAIKAVEAAGGTVTTRYYTNWAIRKIVQGKMDPMVSLGNQEGEGDKIGNKGRRGVKAAQERILNEQSQDEVKSVGEEEMKLEAAEKQEEANAEINSAGESVIRAQQAQTTPSTIITKQYPYRLPDAISRKAIEYYRDEAHRGYLAHTVRKGEGPSLYFRPPNEVAARAAMAAAKQKKLLDENRMW